MNNTTISTLSLYYPAKPYIVTQKFGIYNPAYLPFGFDHHNGEDFSLDKDRTAKAMIDGEVTQTGYIADGAGNYVRYRTGLVEAEGRTCYVEFMYMHAEKVLVKAGDQVKIGQDLIIADNTGFSTGPHTHISAYMFDESSNRIMLDAHTNNCFDHSKYFNGLYAENVGALLPAEYGETSSNVARIQTRLISLGYAIPAGATGFYGPQTKSAVFAFQLERVQLSWYEQFVLKGSNVGPKTLSALQNI